MFTEGGDARLSLSGTGILDLVFGLRHGSVHGTLRSTYQEKDNASAPLFSARVTRASDLDCPGVFRCWRKAGCIVIFAGRHSG